LFNGSGDAEVLAAKDFVRERLGLSPWEPKARTTNGRVEETIRRIEARAKAKPEPKIVATYDYVTADGVLLYQVVRREPKSFVQRRPRPGGGWFWDRGDTPEVLYRLPELLQYPDASVFFTEGEADADRLTSIGLTSTTISGDAADKWTPELAEPLRGRDVFVLQDNDAAGLKRAIAAAQALHGIAKSIRIVLLPDLPPKGDVSDWLKTHRQAELEAECIAAPLYDPTAEAPAAGESTTTVNITAEPYTWKAPESVAPRQWLYGRRLMRKLVAATVAPGGIGKSALTIVEALAEVSGKPLLGILPPRRLRVWIWNLEEPREEIDRQIAATAKLYGLDQDDIGDRLSVNCGDETPLVIAATTRSGATILEPVIDALVEEIKSRSIDVLIIDPFVSCHRVVENNNSEMDVVVKAWKDVAVQADCGIDLVHHTRKGDGEITAESSRGGGAFIDGCRNVRVLNRMTKDEADRARVSNHRFYFRTYSDKANKVPPADKSDWFKLESVDLCNAPPGESDLIGVPRQWQWPDALAGVSSDDFDKVAAAIRAGRWRESSQARDWVGYAVAEALGLNADDKADRARILAMVKTWLAAGALIVVEGEDDKRRKRPFIMVRE
jgi:5S rRNA maturation endonuclease (ribonuclease M5)